MGENVEQNTKTPSMAWSPFIHTAPPPSWHSPRGEASLETMVLPGGKSLGVTSSTPSTVAQFMGVLVLVSPHGSQETVRLSHWESWRRWRGFQHWVLADQICTCRDQL